MRHSTTQFSRHLGADALRPRGMVLWLTLVAMLFFAAMAMYVMNLGRHGERQQMTQDGADAAAIGAAGEVARTFNLVAANNLEMTRLIVAAQILDAMPQASAYTLADQQAMLASLQALAPPNTVPPGGTGETVSDMCNDTISDLGKQVEALMPVVNNFYNNYDTCTPGQLQNLAFGGNDIRESTWYQTPSGQRGTLWKAVEALDKVSQAAIDKMPLTAQLGATASAGKNLPENSRNLVGAVPVRISVPCQRGTFDDFYRPIIKGEIPAASGGADATLHRGPYDTVFGWISEIRDPGTWVPGGTPPPAGPAAPSDGSPFGGNVPSSPPSGTWIPGPITGYRAQGVFNHETWFFRQQVGGPAWPGSGFGNQWGALQGNIGVNTHLTQRAGQIAIRKLMMAQNGASPWDTAYGDLLGQRANTPVPVLHVPNWIFPLDTARQVAKAAKGNPAAPINQNEAYATWIRIEDPSRIPNAKWERVQIPQSRRFFRPPQGQPPVDMFLDAPETAYRIKLADGVYVIFTPVPIIDPKTGQVTGTTPANPVVYLWAGINAPTLELRESPDNAPSPDPTKWAVINNPNNWAANADMPAPTDFLPQYASPPASVVPGQWCVLGFATTPDTAPAWSAKFKSLNYPHHVGLAQARVFNNHSWDLWTPMWHAQLTPISQYDTWLSTLQGSANQAGNGDGINTAELPGFISHLTAIQPLAPLITH